MTLSALIHKKDPSINIATATPARSATPSNLACQTVANVASVAVANASYEKFEKDSDFKEICNWLYQIEEPEEDHHLVVDKCRSNSEVFVYFLNLARKDKPQFNKNENKE